MKTYENSITTTVEVDPQDFKMPFTYYSEWEKQHYLLRYFQLNNYPISLLEKPVYPYCGNYEEGSYHCNYY